MGEAPPILIAGGGIGGLALALALARRGRRSQILEERADPEAPGAGIQLGPNGVRTLERLGLAPALKASVGVPNRIVVHDGRTGRILGELPLGSWINERHGAPYWAAHRGDLHGALLAAAAAEPRITLKPSFLLVAATPTDEGIAVSSAAGEVVSGSALVGADGLWSRVRQMICPNSAPTFAGATATRSVIRASAAGRLGKPEVGLWLTRQAHVVHYPVRGGAEIAVVVIALEDRRAGEWQEGADAAELLGRLRLHESLSSVLLAVRDWRTWALHLPPRLTDWSQNRVTLIGDAAHAMLPYLAQGGALALEDALVLADCVAASAGEASAFRSFEAMRRGRAERVARASRRMGRIYHLAPPLSWGRDLMLRCLPGAQIMARLDWLYGWQPGG